MEVFEWTHAHGFDAVVIGGLAVGAFSAKLDASSLSGDLGLLVSPGEQQRIARAAASDPNVEVLKAIQPRALPVLVLGWGELEVDVLSGSDGLSSDAIQRAWPLVTTGTTTQRVSAHARLLPSDPEGNGPKMAEGGLRRTAGIGRSTAATNRLNPIFVASHLLLPPRLR